VSAFLVFACAACGEKIFAEPSQAGRKGTCPLCRAPTVIGGGAPGPRTKPETDRRRARRVPIANARVACESRTGEGRSTNADEVPVLEDISETGVGFTIKGSVDKKKLAGYGPPPWLKVGDTVSVTLHIPQLFRPRPLKAVVRRIGPMPARKELFRVGAEFDQASEDILKDLKKLLLTK